MQKMAEQFSQFQGMTDKLWMEMQKFTTTIYDDGAVAVMDAFCYN